MYSHKSITVNLNFIHQYSLEKSHSPIFYHQDHQIHKFKIHFFILSKVTIITQTKKNSSQQIASNPLAILKIWISTINNQICIINSIKINHLVCTIIINNSRTQTHSTIINNENVNLLRNCSLQYLQPIS